MIGLVKYDRGPGKLELRDVAERALAAGEVRIRIEAAGLCGSDYHIMQDDIPIALRPPVVIGHEFAGTICELAPNVEGLEVGQRATAETTWSCCGRCRYCLAGDSRLCNERRVVGYWVNGAFAEALIVPARNVHILPDNASFHAGALAEPLACVVHGVVELAQVAAGQSVLITGPGPIGLLALQVVLAQGASTIVCGLSRDAERLELASRLGARAVVNVEAEDPVARVLELTDGFGADVGIECSGAGAGLSLCLAATAKQGTVCRIGIAGRPVEVDVDLALFREIRLASSFSSTATAWQRVMRLLAEGRINSEAMVSAVLTLNQWEQAFEMYHNKQGLKVIFAPGGRA